MSSHLAERASIAHSLRRSVSGREFSKQTRLSSLCLFDPLCDTALGWPVCYCQLTYAGRRGEITGIVTGLEREDDVKFRDG